MSESQGTAELKATRPDYGNWVSTRLLYITGVPGVLLLGLAIPFPILMIGAIPFLLAFAYFLYARRQFSPTGGNVQARIHQLVVDRLDWAGEGKALDIGCGNGPLTIKVAQRFPRAQVTGIDYWGGMWKYSKDVCERNAEREGVAGRVTFQKASAAALPFPDECFDAAVSNLVFHEVGGIREKRDVVKEALRVVKKGGSFAFQDLFRMKKAYGDMDDLLETIRRWGIESVQYLDTSDLASLPKALRLPFMVGTIGILYGKK